ncbi:response regulator, partial [Chloroflexota bacterium]
DDHPPFREGLVKLFAQEEDIATVAEASNGVEAVELACELLPDVVIVDMSMPKLGGVEAIKRIKTACPSIAILVLSAYGDDPYVFGSLEAGASGYLLKNVRVKELIAAIRSVNAGELVLDPSVSRKVLGRLTSSKIEAENETGNLQQRELEVLKLAARGESNKQIADELYISVRTVQAHLASVFSKLEVGSRTEAIAHALKEGWFTVEDLR